jgi:hypothetical protein
MKLLHLMSVAGAISGYHAFQDMTPKERTGISTAHNILAGIVIPTVACHLTLPKLTEPPAFSVALFAATAAAGLLYTSGYQVGKLAGYAEEARRMR